MSVDQIYCPIKSLLLSCPEQHAFQDTFVFMQGYVKFYPILLSFSLHFSKTTCLYIIVTSHSPANVINKIDRAYVMRMSYRA